MNKDYKHNCEINAKVPKVTEGKQFSSCGIWVPCSNSANSIMVLIFWLTNCSKAFKTCNNQFKQPAIWQPHVLTIWCTGIKFCRSLPFVQSSKYSSFILQVSNEPVLGAQHCSCMKGTVVSKTDLGSCSQIKNSLPFSFIVFLICIMSNTILEQQELTIRYLEMKTFSIKFIMSNVFHGMLWKTVSLDQE